jgi:hypothetical protein
VEEIFETCQFVPQLKDLSVGTRVALLKWENATGRVVRMPEKRVLSGLAHVIVSYKYFLFFIWSSYKVRGNS